MKFELNFEDLFEIDTTPSGATRTWARLGKGIQSCVPATNENIDQTPYLDGNGFGNSDVIGAQLIYTATGHRVSGDPAQDFIFSLRFAIGNDRKTNFRTYDSEGNLAQGPCTIANVTIGGGDANGKKAFGCEIHINGEPTVTDAVPADDLSVVIAAGATTGTTTATATPDAGDTLSYTLTSAEETANANEYPGIMTAYTSGAEIPATAGQYLNVYELSAYGRVVKFASTVLSSGDIGA